MQGRAVCGFADSGRPRTAYPWRHIVGVTLVELVMYIVVVSVGVAGILSVMTYTARHSGDPMIQQQALLVAEAYMQEILIKPFVAPGASQVCPSPPALRINYDNVCDFNGLNDIGARDQLGAAISSLENYTVAVSVSGGSGISLGPVGNPVNNTGAVRVLRVDITVTNTQAPDLRSVVTGYRVSFNCSNAADAACRPL